MLGLRIWGDKKGSGISLLVALQRRKVVFGGEING